MANANIELAKKLMKRPKKDSKGENLNLQTNF